MSQSVVRQLDNEREVRLPPKGYIEPAAQVGNEEVDIFMGFCYINIPFILSFDFLRISGGFVYSCLIVVSF